MSAAALAFVAAALAAVGVASLVPPGALRLRRPASGEERPVAGGGRWIRTLVAVGRRLAPVAGLAAPRELEVRIAAAGLSGPAAGRLAGLEASELMAAKLAAAALGGIGGVVLGAAAPGRLGILLVAAGPVGGFMAPDIWLARRARARARAIRRELPAMLDLLRVTVEAGLPLAAALAAVGERTRGTLGAEWRVVGREVELGMPLGDSLRVMLRRTPLPELRTLIATLERAVRHGVPLAGALAAQARDARA